MHISRDVSIHLATKVFSTFSSRIDGSRYLSSGEALLRFRAGNARMGDSPPRRWYAQNPSFCLLERDDFYLVLEVHAAARLTVEMSHNVLQIAVSFPKIDDLTNFRVRLPIHV